jgi:hypothetical protein
MSEADPEVAEAEATAPGSPPGPINRQKSDSVDEIECRICRCQEVGN